VPTGFPIVSYSLADCPPDGARRIRATASPTPEATIMTILANIAVDSDAFELGEILSDGETDTYIELTQFVPVGESLVPYFWVIDSADLEAYERAVQADSRVERLVRLNGAVDRTLYRIEWHDPENLDGFLDALCETHVLVERASAAHDEWVFRLRADTQKALSAFQQACFEAGVQLDIRRVMHNPSPAGPNPFGISEKQAEALELAFERGYR
jgi:hypothetical protein